MIDFKEIPEWWAVCPNADCEVAEGCLRRQACKQVPAEVMTWKCVLPHVVKGGECKFFQPYEKVTMAKGINAIYNNVHDKQARVRIRTTLTSFFGSKGTYYRYKDGERLITPRLQEEIRGIVNTYAPDAEVTFDETFVGYDFTQHGNNPL